MNGLGCHSFGTLKDSSLKWIVHTIFWSLPVDPQCLWVNHGESLVFVIAVLVLRNPCFNGSTARPCEIMSNRNSLIKFKQPNHQWCPFQTKWGARLVYVYHHLPLSCSLGASPFYITLLVGQCHVPSSKSTLIWKTYPASRSFAGAVLFPLVSRVFCSFTRVCRVNFHIPSISSVCWWFIHPWKWRGPKYTIRS